LADKVLSGFRADLDSQTEERIGEAGFQRLHGLIGEALSEELESVSGRFEDLLQELRAEIDKREIEL
jgi:hypothetical protein